MNYLKIVRVIKLVSFALLYKLLTLFVPKKKNKWIFGSWKGKTYSDNSRALFEYVSNNHPEIEAIWVAKNPNVFHEVISKGYGAIDYNTWRGKLSVMNAGASVQTESNEDTGGFKISGTKVIQLWHGMGESKKTYVEKNVIKRNIISIYSDSRENSYWMVSSNAMRSMFHNDFHIPYDHIFVTGMPKTDLLVKKEEVTFFEEFKKNHPTSQIIAYMPTHRNYGKSDYNIFSDPQLPKVNEYLRSADSYLFIKPHPLERYKYLEFVNRYSNIVLLADELFDFTQSYLFYFDIMIADYSSVIFDYLFLNRPIILYVYDLNEFEKNDVGIKETYKENQLGPFCSTWDDIIRELEALRSHDKYKEIRGRMISKYYKYVDENNSCRVVKEIKNICGIYEMSRN